MKGDTEVNCPQDCHGERGTQFQNKEGQKIAGGSSLRQRVSEAPAKRLADHPRQDMHPIDQPSRRSAEKRTISGHVPDCHLIRDFLEERRLPQGIEDQVKRYIAGKTGKQWNDPITLSRIRSAIQRQKAGYWKDGGDRRTVGYRKGYDVLAYLAYHLPVYHQQISCLLARLLCSGEIQSDLVLLDAGSGPGVVPLGAISVWSRISGGSLTIHAIERAPENREAYSALVKGYAASDTRIIHPPPVDGDLRAPGSFTLPGDVDLLVLENVLNEWTGDPPARHASHILSLARSLKKDGRILLVEPAERRASTMLRQTAALLVQQGWYIRGPCPPSLHSRLACRADSCWSFEELPPIQPTSIMRTLGEGGQRFRFENTDVKFSWVLLARRGSAGTLPASGVKDKLTGGKNAESSPFNSLGRLIGRRVTVTARKISPDLGQGGDQVFLLCDGTQERPVYAVLPSYHQTPRNSLLLNLPYAAPICLKDVLVRYNPHHNSFNLLVTRGSSVIHPRSSGPNGGGFPPPILSSARAAERSNTRTGSLSGYKPDRTRKGNRETHHLHPRNGPRRDRRNP